MCKETKNLYLQNHEASGIKAGDIVKVLRKAESFENGWRSFWSTIFMSPNLGSMGKVVSDEDESGFVVDICGTYFRYPYFVLEKV